MWANKVQSTKLDVLLTLYFVFCLVSYLVVRQSTKINKKICILYFVSHKDCTEMRSYQTTSDVDVGTVECHMFCF